MYAGGVLEICLTSFLFWRFVQPFMLRRQRTGIVGVIYALVMLVLKFFPYEIDSRICYGVGVAAVFLVMYGLDRRNTEQKIFLVVTFYLLEWIAWGIILGPWDTLYQFLVMRPSIAKRNLVLFLTWLVMEVLFVTMDVSAKALLIKVIQGAYHDKKENMTKKEFALLLAPSLSVVVGYWIISYFCNIYGMDSGQYIDDTHNEYIWFRALYMAVSFAALLTVIISYQRIKDGQRKEKEDAVLSRQMEDLKRHVEEVEQLYFDIRSLKHDMANHVMLLESLYGKSGEANREKSGRLESICDQMEKEGNVYEQRTEAEKENAEAAEYMAQLRLRVEEATLEMRSGNPVTDVILREKRREAEAKGIIFRSDFHYPSGTCVEAFDVSILLNNAINNAIEAAWERRESYISVLTYFRKNAYMIEVRNSFEGQLAVDEESGLPVTTKNEPGHGFGLASMRKVAQKYHGDIDICQDDGEFVLSIMLMMI